VRLFVIALPVMIAAAAQAATAPAKPAKPNPDVDICVKAAAATDHIKIEDVDRDACACATKELQRTLSPDDFALHETMLGVIASGANERSFNKQMSDIMLKRGMNQQMVNAFLARTKKAQDKAHAKCNVPPPLDLPDLNHPPH
jgi:hypothetical protein